MRYETAGCTDNGNQPPPVLILLEIPYFLFYHERSLASSTSWAPLRLADWEHTASHGQGYKTLKPASGGRGLR